MFYFIWNPALAIINQYWIFHIHLIKRGTQVFQFSLTIVIIIVGWFSFYIPHTTLFSIRLKGNESLMEKPLKNCLLFFTHTQNTFNNSFSLTLPSWDLFINDAMLNDGEFCCLISHSEFWFILCCLTTWNKWYLHCKKHHKTYIAATRDKHLHHKKLQRTQQPTMAIKLNEMGKLILLEKSNKIIKKYLSITENRAWKVLSSLMFSFFSSSLLSTTS